MKIVLGEEIRLVREERFHKTYGYLDRFLHDIAQLSRDSYLPAALCKQSLYKQDLSACGSPGESCHDTGFFLFKHMAVTYGFHVKVILEGIRIYGKCIKTAPHYIDRSYSAESVYTFF